MNWWWPFFIVLGCMWAVPMAMVSQCKWGSLASFAAGCLWLFTFGSAAPLYDWGTRLLRTCGPAKVAAWREKMKRRILPPIRIALFIPTILSFGSALL